MILTLENQGNTSAATIPLAINKAIAQGRLKRGMKVLLTAAGAGFTWEVFCLNIDSSIPCFSNKLFIPFHIMQRQFFGSWACSCA